MDQSSRRTPSTRMAQTMARIQASSTPSEKFGTQATIRSSMAIFPFSAAKLPRAI
jgi:hypothetical protein